MSLIFCPECGLTVSSKARSCPHCGYPIEAIKENIDESLKSAPCPWCKTPIPSTMDECPQCKFPMDREQCAADIKRTFGLRPKDRVIAILLAIFLGGLGIHKFYLNRPGQGVLYLLFCWTFIPSIIAIIDAIHYLMISEEKFQKKYRTGGL